MPRRTTDTERRKAQILSWFGRSSIPPIPFAAEDAMFVTGFNEFAYGTDIYYGADGHPLNGIYEWLSKDRRLLYPHPAAATLPLPADAQSDFRWMLKQNLTQMPVKRVVLWLNWFTVWYGSGAFIQHQNYCRPAISGDVVDNLVNPTDWHVATYDAGDAALNPGSGQIHRLPSSADAPLPALAGTPDDNTVIAAMRLLKAQGIDVGIACIPRFLNLSGGAGEGWEIWRGLISSSSYGYDWSSITALQEWLAEWRVMFRHYASLAQTAGVTPWIFYLGSEMRETAINSDREVRETFLANMIQAAREVHITLGSTSTRIVYGADWSEYHARPGETSFADDVLFSNHYLAGPALDWYQPVADVHTESPCDIGKGIWGGENSDYYFNFGADPAYSATHRLLVDSGDPTDGLGKSELTPVPLDPGYASKRLPAYIEGAHYQSAADQPISDPTPPTDWSGTVRAKVSPAPGMWIETGDGIGLGGVTLSDMVGPSDIVVTGTGGEKLLADVFSLPVGLGVRTPPWNLLKYLPLNDAADDYVDQTAYYAFKMPTYSRQYRVANTGDALPDNTINFGPETATNKQPTFLRFENGSLDGEGDDMSSGVHGMSRYNHRYTVEIVLRIDNIPHDANHHRYLAFGHSGVENVPFFKIAVSKDANVNYHHFEFGVRQYNYGKIKGDGWAWGRWSDNGEQDTNRFYPSDAGSVYRVQLRVDSHPTSIHAVPSAECRVWNISKGNTLIFNQVMSTSGIPEYWNAPAAGSLITIGAGYDTAEDSGLTGFLPGRLYYAGMWDHGEESWGGHFWLDDTYAGTDSIRTGWLPAMRPADITELGYPSMYGMDSEPSTFPTLYIDDGTQPDLPATFKDYAYWQRLRDRYTNAAVYDLGGPYGAGMSADERHQALLLAVAMEQMHNSTVRTQDGQLMKTINSIVVYNMDTRTLDTQLAPSEDGLSLYFGDGMKHRVNHALNDKLANQLTKSGASGSATISGGAGIGQSPGLSVPPPAPATGGSGSSGSPVVLADSESRVWFGV